MNRAMAPEPHIPQYTAGFSHSLHSPALIRPCSVVRSTDSGARLLRFKSWLCYLLAE